MKEIYHGITIKNGYVILVARKKGLSKNMAYLAEIKITYTQDGKEEKINYVLSTEKKEDFLDLLKHLAKAQVPEDIE